MTVYNSKHHPGTAPAALVIARAHVRPLALCMLPVMILASLSVLLAIDPLGFLAWSVPLAYLAASGWALFSLQRTLAECWIDEDVAGVRTVWQVAFKQKLQWWYLLGVKPTGSSLLVSIGHTVYELYPADWPNFDQLHAALDRASDQARLRFIS